MKSTARTVGLVMIIMVLSRIMAFISNQIYLTHYGINLEMDIYSYATQLPNIIFVSFGTAIVTVVIPIFAGYIGTNEKEKAFKFADNIITLSLLFTALLVVISIFVVPFILILIPRFKNEGLNFAILAFRIMLPIMIFYALNYLLQGVLQSMGKFGMPAFVSVPSSLILIVYVFTLGNSYGVKGLLIATFIGLSFQALILIPPVLKTEYRYRPSFDYKSEDVKKAFLLVPPVLLGASAIQLNMLFNTTLSANYKDSVAIMLTVQNLILYSILAFVYSITAVVFPKLTMLAAKNDMEGFKNSLNKVIRTILYFLIPATVGFIAVSHQLVNLFYGWKKVTGENVYMGGIMLALYAVGIAGVGIKEVVDRAFYSLKDTKKPAINGVIVMLVNIILSSLLTLFMGVYGIPLAYSIAALTGAFVLLYFIKKKIGSFAGRELLIFLFKIVVSSAIMLIVVVLINIGLSLCDFGTAVPDRSVKLIVPVGVGALTFILATYFLNIDETKMIIYKLRGKLSFKNKIIGGN